MAREAGRNRDGETVTQLQFEFPTAAEMRTESEIREAHQVLADFIYPPKRIEMGIDEGFLSRPSFQGWQTSVSKYRYPHGVCDKKDCGKPATVRIRLNIWGSLYECDVCREHGTFSDGRSRDGAWVDDL